MGREDVGLNATRQRRILIVDDSPLMLDMMTFALKGMSAEVVRARSGLDALEQAALAPFDLVLTDVVMPGLGGIELIQGLRQLPEYRAVPIVVVSTQGARDAIDAGLAAGANDYLTKPFRPQDLVRTVRRHLEE